MKKLILIVLLLISTSAFAASINAAAYRTMQMQSYPEKQGSFAVTKADTVLAGSIKLHN